LKITIYMFIIISYIFSMTPEEIKNQYFNKLIKEEKKRRIDEEIKILKKVNSKINLIKYRSDKKNWNKSDYWATYKEFLKKGSGDCEDFAIAKYYVLKNIGINYKKMSFGYNRIKIKGKYTNHLVLLYYIDNKDPLILDNVNKRIFRLNKRKDIKMIYTFNLNQKLKKENIKIYKGEK